MCNIIIAHKICWLWHVFETIRNEWKEKENIIFVYAATLFNQLIYKLEKY